MVFEDKDKIKKKGLFRMLALMKNKVQKNWF